MPQVNRKERYLKRLAALEEDRRSFDPHWRELGEFILPRRTRFLDAGDERNRGTKRHQKIINNSAPWPCAC